MTSAGNPSALLHGAGGPEENRQTLEGRWLGKGGVGQHWELAACLHLFEAGGGVRYVGPTNVARSQLFHFFAVNQPHQASVSTSV